MQKIKFPKPCSSWLILFINLSFVFTNLKIAVKSLFFKVSTIFWWDNFDRNIETVSGAGSVHNTPGVVFQENSAAAVKRHEDVSIPRSKRRSLQLSTENVDKRVAINPKAEPPSFAGLQGKPPPSNAEQLCAKLLLLWKSARYLNSANQTNPRFVGWIIRRFQRAHSQATQMTYLPPISSPITEYSTIIEMFHQSRKLAKQSNMSYTHITLDVGAAIKAFHVIWNKPDEWSDIIIHLGDFHAMMAFFGVIGRFVESSGFEDVMFQAGLCSSGSIAGVMSGKHYNRCWLVHEVFSEALERLFIEQYLPTIPKTVEEFLLNESDEVTANSHSDGPLKDYVTQYQTQKSKCLDREFGKTPQYWAKYMELVDHQHKLHFSINTNDYDLRMLIWKESLPLCFATSRVHYARYGTYYVNCLEYLDTTHPGARQEIEDFGLSVRRNQLGVGQSIDMAGEQSFMRNAKTAGELI